MQPVGRRWVLQKTLAGAVGLGLGLRGQPLLAEPAPASIDEGAPEHARFSEILRITPDNRIVLVPPVAEMGQNVITSLAALVAEELEVDWSRVEVEIAPHHPDFYNVRGQAAGNSRAVRIWYQPLRQLGAAARMALTEAAAQRWQVSVSGLIATKGRITDPVSGKTATYGELCEAAAALPLPASPSLRAPGEWRLLGQTQIRKDGEAKVTGAAQFGADVRLPGMVYAAVRMAPDPGGSVALGQTPPTHPNVLSITNLDDAVAVVATTWWRANAVLKTLSITHQEGAFAQAGNTAIATELEAALSDGRGTVAMASEQALSNEASGWVEARYHQPFLAHACMEPMTATVSVEADRVLVYAPTQSPKRSAEQVAAHLGRPVADIQMFNTYLGGGFGRKGLDFGATFQAATLSAQLGRPVQVIWDRETDIEQDQFRPAAAYRCRARLNDAGMPTDLELRIATQSLRKQLFPQFYHPEIVEVSPTPFPYEVPALEIRWCEAELPIRVGFWRAVHSSAHPFAIESFIDHLAHQTGQDPYRYRRALLFQKPRLRAVLDTVADLAGWGRTLPAGHGLGIACIEGWGSFCAQVAEVSVSAEGFSVERIWVAADCGVVLCPGTVEAQLQGAVADVLGMVLAGGVSFDRGAAVQNNFHTYPMLRCHQMPEVTVSMVASEEAPGGVGELGVPCVAAAVANAVFAASGHRATELPIRLGNA